MSSLGYDRRQAPPAPMLEVGLDAPAGRGTVVVAGAVDTGSDVTLLPTRLVQRLGLPRISRAAISGVDGRPLGVHVHGVQLRFAGGSTWCTAMAFGDEVIIGRDVLNLGVLQLDGPRLRGSFRWTAR